MTFSLGLVERPEFIYTVNAKMYGEDLIHQIGNAVQFYSGKMVIANSQTQRGFSIRSVNTLVYDTTNYAEKFYFGYSMMNLESSNGCGSKLQFRYNTE